MLVYKIDQAKLLPSSLHMEFSMISTYLGIDVSKENFDCILLYQTGNNYHKSCSNNTKGFHNLVDWLRKKKIETSQIHICMESTGIYSLPLAEFLFERNFYTSVVNPLKIKFFGTSMLMRTKTDRADAKLIARYCEKMSPARWEPKPENVKKLRELVARLNSLKEMHRQEANRLETINVSEVRDSVKKYVRSFQKEMIKIEDKIKILIDSDIDLKKKVELLSSIPGVSNKTSWEFLSHICADDFEKGRQVSAFIGLNPRQRQSGSSVNGNTRLSKIGVKELRSSLYMPAVCAATHNPVLKRFYERLLLKGKKKMVALGAVMRKLTHIMFSVLKKERMFFDPAAEIV